MAFFSGAIRYFSVSKSFVQWNSCGDDNVDSKPLHGWKWDRRGQTQEFTQNILFMTKGQRGKHNLWHVFIRSIVWVNAEIWCPTHRHWACQFLASPPKPPSSTPGNYNFLPHSSRCDFVLFLRSCFTKSFVKLHKSWLSPVKPSLGKQWRGNSAFLYTEKDYRNLNRLGFEFIVSKPTAANLIHNEMQKFQFQLQSWFYWKQSNVVHLVCAGAFMHAHHEFLLIAVGCMACGVSLS